MPQGRRRGSRKSQLSPRSRAEAELKEKLEVIRQGMKGALKVLTPAELVSAANAMTKTVHSPDDVIFEQGQHQSAAIIIMDGYADVRRQLRNGQRRKITQLEPGDIFGESMLIFPSEQENSLVAHGWCVTLALESEVYVELFGDRREAVQELLDATSERMRALALQSRAEEEAAHQRLLQYNMQHKTFESMTQLERDAATDAQRKEHKPTRFQPAHEHAIALRVGPANFTVRDTSRPKFYPGQRVIYRTRLFTHGQGRGEEVAGNVGTVEDGGRSSKQGGFLYRVWFRHDNIVYDELKTEIELEDALANKRRKMMNFLFKLLQTRRYAGFHKWRMATNDWREEARMNAMALKIQTVFRIYSGKLSALALQKSQLQMRRIRRKQRRLAALQDREREREEWEMQYAKENGYTLDGIRFFKTSTALREWCDKASQFLESWERLLHRDDADKRTRAFRRWRNNILKIRFAEQNRLVLPLETLEQANEMARRNPTPKVLSDKFSPSQWHPALGLRLPPLPVYSGTEALLNGEVKIVDVKRYRSFQRSMSGPLDCGNWLIPPRVLIGGFPWGQARRKNNVIKARGDCISVMLLKSITVFVCLMPDDELEAAKEKFNCEFEAELAKKHGYLLGQLKQGLENAKRNYDRALEMCERTEGYADDYRRPYVVKKEKMEIIYESQRKRWEAFPKTVQLLKFPMPANPNITVPDRSLLEFLPKVEKVSQQFL